MKQVLDLAGLDWTLSGSSPHLWRFERMIGAKPSPDVAAIPAKVPGSVQQALREASILPDWNVGMNSRKCEWVENRHWIFRAELPAPLFRDTLIPKQARFRLNCRGLDYSGWVLLNEAEVGAFKGSFVPHVFDLTPHLKESENVLEIVFDIPPRWLGQFGYTSQVTEWKPRYNYTWDWVPRLVQIGIWDAISIEVIPVIPAKAGIQELGIKEFGCTTDVNLDNGTGSLRLTGGAIGDAVRLSLLDGDRTLKTEEIPAARLSPEGLIWSNLPVELWWPNGDGAQKVYSAECVLLDSRGNQIDSVRKQIGFRHVEWQPCEGAPEGVDPWLCVVNGKPVFLAGANWAPIRGYFADLTEADYRKRLEAYRDIGFNVIRINGCGFAEHNWLYDICDELGILVWQDFPLSSSGMDNWPPEDEKAMDEMEQIVRHYVGRLRHHASILLWCGGNELQGDLRGNKTGIGKPVDFSHPLIARQKQVVEELDPLRRLVPTSGSGPAGYDWFNTGKGMHWDVHGPYASFDTIEAAEDYYRKDDALFRSEVSSPGASSVEIIREYLGDCEEFPCSADNPYWARPTAWWIEWDKFIALNGRKPKNLEEYVAWSQERQAWNLAAAYRIRRQRFPTNGGIMIWTGHDTFPIPVNTSILDYYGNPKPAALAIARELKKEAK